VLILAGAGGRPLGSAAALVMPADRDLFR